PGDSSIPIWSPDGAHIYFMRDKRILRKAASGAGQEEPVYEAGDFMHHMSISGDGRALVFESGARSQSMLLLPLARGADKKTSALVRNMRAVDPQLPPGTSAWIAYASPESGRFEVYAQSFPPGRGKWQVSTTGGMQPRWRRDGRELYYIADDQ